MGVLDIQSYLKEEFRYKGQPYRFSMSYNPTTDSYTLFARNVKTKEQKSVGLSYYEAEDLSFIFLQIGYIMTNIWMRKYTPVDVKLKVTTSDLIEELLCLNTLAIN